jgi:hypothetical protein
VNGLPGIVECLDQDLNRLRVEIPICPERTDEPEHRSAFPHPRTVTLRPEGPKAKNASRSKLRP